MSAGRKSETTGTPIFAAMIGGFARLPGTGDAAAEKRLRDSLVIERLAVTADQFAFQSRAPLRGANRVGIKIAQQEVQPREIGHTGRLSIHRRQHRAPDFGGIGKLDSAPAIPGGSGIRAPECE